ncbi:MAG: hypothetical protein J6T51_03295 [Kiritimatiellae bacterium]|nr:hypothetical protein [Kiritimatiellia bacterium]
MDPKETLGACADCRRRDFLVKLGALAGAGFASRDILAMLPPPVSPDLIPDKAGAVKVRLIFAYHTPNDIQAKPDWPNVGYDFRPAMKNMTDTLNWQIPGVEFIPTPSLDRDHTKGIVLADEKAGEIKGYMVVQLNCWNNCISGVWENTRKATFYTSLPYAGDGGWLRHNSHIMTHLRPHYASFAAFDFSQVVKVARAFEVLKDGTAEDFQRKAFEYRNALIPADTPPKGVKVIDDRVKCVTPDEALAKLKGLKILSVQNTPTQPYAEEVEKTFGIVIERVPFDEVNDAARAADEAEARAVAKSWTDKASRIEYVTDETILGCARIYLGMKKTMAAHGAKAITINCLGGCYTGKLDAYPCLGFMQLQDDGLMGVCENDVNSTITMLAFSALTGGRVGYVSDPVLDMPNRAISYAHCVSTRRFFGPTGPEAEFEILTHSEDRKGASVRSFAPVGEPVTTVKVNILARKIALHTGVVTANDTDDRACRTKIVARVTGDYSKIELAWINFSWHRVTFMGDFRSDVEAFAKKIGYEVVYES